MGSLTPCFFYCLVIVLVSWTINFKNKKSCLVVVTHALNPSIWEAEAEAEARGSLNLR